MKVTWKEEKRRGKRRWNKNMSIRKVAYWMLDQADIEPTSSLADSLVSLFAFCNATKLTDLRKQFNRKDR